MTKRSVFYMAGTEGTGEYMVLAITSRGRIGVRVLDGNIENPDEVATARVRLEPSEGPKTLKTITRQLSGWRQPDSEQYRFSTVVDDISYLKSSLAEGLSVIGAGVLQTRKNPAAPLWMQDLITT